MSKTDDFIKDLLNGIETDKLNKLVFIGASNQDQKLWVEGGLTFGFNGYKYGSCDFAWYSNDTWKDPLTGNSCNAKPLIVVEGTDCLNTRSWGSTNVAVTEGHQ